MPVLSPFSNPVYVMAKPVGAACNLACSYCYYLEKGAAPTMSDRVLEDFIRQYIEMQTTDSVLFTWHGGEPMLAGLDFYRKAVRLQRRYAGGRHIDNALQTNGTRLTPEWCDFLRDEGWLAGISIDGPQHLHDALRTYRNGAPSWERVMHGIHLLETHGVEWNAMATVNAVNVQHPKDFYHFFRDLGCHYLQFTPVVERTLPNGRLTPPCTTDGDNTDDNTPRLTAESITPEAWGEFLCSVFDEWVRADVGEMFVQLFDATLAGWMSMAPGVCTLAPTCGHAAIIEADGSVYACDHFAFPQYRLGKLTKDQSLFSLLYDERQRRFGLGKSDALPSQCRQCQWLFACHGECPRLRFASTADGQPGLNYLCTGYQRYFAHVAPAMDFMRNELQAERPPANVMQLYQAR